MGGLGNQMFQFAAAKNVAKLLNEDYEIIFDTSFVSHIHSQLSNCKQMFYIIF
jgi:hypothetical protein